MAVSEVDKAYIAGFFDGEGCIAIHRAYRRADNTGVYAIRVTIAQNEREVLVWIKSLYSGYLGMNQNKRTSMLHINGSKAVTFLHDVLPFLRVKTEQVELAILAYDTKTVNAETKGRLSQMKKWVD